MMGFKAMCTRCNKRSARDKVLCARCRTMEKNMQEFKSPFKELGIKRLSITK